MSEPGPDYTQAITDALGAAVSPLAGYAEYRVSQAGDVTPTSGAGLGEVLDGPDLAPGTPPEPAWEEAFDPAAPSPVDVSAMGGAIFQWWVSDEDAAETQAVADQVNAVEGGAAVPGSDGPELGWQPFPPGPAGMVVQSVGSGMFGAAPLDGGRPGSLPVDNAQPDGPGDRDGGVW